CCMQVAAVMAGDSREVDGPGADQGRIVAGNPMVGQNDSNGSTSVEGGIQREFASDATSAEEECATKVVKNLTGSTTQVILQLALQFGIVTELVLLKTPYQRRPCTGKRTQGPFSWEPAVGGEGVCRRLTLPNVEISWPLLSYRAKKLIGGSKLRYSWIIGCVCGKLSAIEDTRESKGQTWRKSFVGSAEYL
ncbi:hypothetical protein Tco_1383276, partial [Tanacetum coccineum]